MSENETEKKLKKIVIIFERKVIFLDDTLTSTIIMIDAFIFIMFFFLSRKVQNSKEDEDHP